MTATTQTPRLEFWFDFASTYSYLTAQRLEGLAAAAGVTVLWKPFLLGPAFIQVYRILLPTLTGQQ